MAVFALAAALPGAADEPVWRHDVGLRAGGVGSLPIFLPFAGSLSAFCEVRSDRNWGLRPALEFTMGKEWGLFGDMGYDVDIRRVGATMDFVFYPSREGPLGTGFFMTAGAGWHRFDIKDGYERYHQGQWVQDYRTDTQNAASLSVGVGYYFGKAFGMEMKYSVSNQDSELTGGIGRDWLAASVNLRFQAPGRRKEEHPRDAAYRIRRDAERAETDRLPLWMHKIGASLDFSPVLHDAAYSIFYEKHLDGRWAVRPALDIVHGSDEARKDGSGTINIDGAGLSVDCLFYASGRRQNGIGPYLLAGLGARWVSLKSPSAYLGDGTLLPGQEQSGAAPALSVGAGYYFGRYCGVEYRHSFSTLDSPFPGDVGKNWWRLGLNVRFPAPGQARDETRTGRAEASWGPPWKHKFGLRLGALLLYPKLLTAFYENQINGRWAIRPSIEFMVSDESYLDAYSNPIRVDIDRLGAAVDCIYYVLRRGRSGVGPYLLAGLGVHSIDMKDEGDWNDGEKVYRQASDVAPALSVGLGYHFSRYFGVEYKHTFSALDTPFPEKLGKNWAWLSLNFRFPAQGLARGGQGHGPR
jgi:opacity protein-like surface antigen